MNGKISRRKLAVYVADALLDKRHLATILEELAAYLIESNRVRETELVVRAIEDVLARRGQVIARVTSAHELSSEVRRAVEKLIDAPKVYIDTTVDSSVIGGLRVETPDALLDTTIAHNITALTRAKI